MMLPGPREPEYRAYYRRVAKDGRHYVILDNGAWETKALQPGDLIGTAWRFRVQEVVVPDVLNNSRATLKAVQKFFAVWQDFHLASPNWSPRFMVVTQGASLDEAKDLIEKVARNFPEVKVIAAGRSLTRNIGDPHARAKLAEWCIEYLPSRFAFHLLGHNDAWPGEIAACRDLVRSTDTAAPFKAALHGKELRTLTEHSIPRPKDYFSLPASRFDLALLEANIEYMKEVA